MASPSKLVTADNFFPKKDILRPQKMPAIFHDDLKELGLIDVWGMDMTVDDEASWLYEILPPSKPRVNSIMMKSTSLGALNASGQFGLSEPNSVEDEEPFPRQSTPVGKGTWPAGGGRGDGPGVSPINNGDPVDRTVTGKVPKAVNRTFEAEKKEEKATLSSETSPDENNAPGGQLNKTHDRLPQTEGTVKNAIPRVAPVKQTSIPPPGGSSGIPSSGLRPPSRPPVTQAVEPSMHRTTSLGNLSANKKLTIPPASSNRPPIAHPPNGATAVNGIARNGGGGVAPKIVTSSRLVRPFAAPAKLPNLPPPTGVPSALSRIPKTTAAVKK